MENITLQLLIVFSITPILLLIIMVFMYMRINKMNEIISNLKSEINTQKQKNNSFLKFYIGSKALLNDYQLTNTNQDGKKTDFSVDYEVEVVDISETEIKVKAINFVGNDSFSRDPKNKTGIIGFMQDRWISKKEAQLIMDESHNRQAKLEELGI
jgi:hypothetical protein